MTFEDEIAEACAGIPGLLHSALFVVPEGFVVGGSGARNHWDSETLVRAAVCCFAAPPVKGGAGAGTTFAEFAFVRRDRFIVVQRGSVDARLGLAASCTAEANLALILGATRRAIRGLETSRLVDRFGL